VFWKVLMNGIVLICGWHSFHGSICFFILVTYIMIDVFLHLKSMIVLMDNDGWDGLTFTLIAQFIFACGNGSSFDQYGRFVMIFYFYKAFSHLSKVWSVCCNTQEKNGLSSRVCLPFLSNRELDTLLIPPHLCRGSLFSVWRLAMECSGNSSMVSWTELISDRIPFQLWLGILYRSVQLESTATSGKNWTELISDLCFTSIWPKTSTLNVQA
jgi:hypothetical protein